MCVFGLWDRYTVEIEVQDRLLFASSVFRLTDQGDNFQTSVLFFFRINKKIISHWLLGVSLLSGHWTFLTMCCIFISPTENVQYLKKISTRLFEHLFSSHMTKANKSNQREWDGNFIFTIWANFLEITKRKHF